MQLYAFLSWKIEPKTINNNVKEFKALSVKDQKRFLIECLDKNMLFVPLSEIYNDEFGVSNEDKKLNACLYERE